MILSRNFGTCSVCNSKVKLKGSGYPVKHQRAGFRRSCYGARRLTKEIPNINPGHSNNPVGYFN